MNVAGSIRLVVMCCPCVSVSKSSISYHDILKTLRQEIGFSYLQENLYLSVNTPLILGLDSYTGTLSALIYPRILVVVAVDAGLRNFVGMVAAAIIPTVVIRARMAGVACSGIRGGALHPVVGICGDVGIEK